MDLLERIERLEDVKHGLEHLLGEIATVRREVDELTIERNCYRDLLERFMGWCGGHPGMDEFVAEVHDALDGVKENSQRD